MVNVPLDRLLYYNLCMPLEENSLERRTLLLATIAVVLGKASAASPAIPLSAKDTEWMRRYQAQNALEAKAEKALEAADNHTATRYATELLRINTDTKSWHYGNIIYTANQILGLAALQEGNIAVAKDFLLKAGKTPGSPQLDSFGPEMPLAQGLLERGERDVVLEFLDLIAVFWATAEPDEEPLHHKVAQRNAEKIARWKADIRGGNVPTLDRFA
jgi:hypothetical protein